MKIERNWKDIAELVGIAAIVASLIFVGIQLRQDQEIAEAQIYADSNIISTEMADLITANRDIWRAGLDGEQLNPSDEVVFQNLFVTMRLVHGGIWQRALRLGTRTPESVSRQFAYIVYSHRGLRRLWDTFLKAGSERATAYGGIFSYDGSYQGSPFEDEVQQYLLQLDESGPGPTGTKLYTSWF